MGKFEDLTGKQFGRWSVISFIEVREVGKAKVKKAFWLCECQCDKHTRREVPSDSLKCGNSKSCGCLKVESTIKRSTKHGYARRGKNGTSIYHVWHEIKARCFNQNDKAYTNYGGRGISMCDEWKNSFIAFKDWAYSNGYQEGLTIDRIDNNGNYEPDNCRWVNYKVQANNTRSCRYLEINGERKTISQWCDVYGISSSVVYTRIDTYHWDVIKALTKPPRCLGTRKVNAVILVKDGKIVSRYNSATEASLMFNIGCTQLRKACRRQAKNYYGYDWYYEKDYISMRNMQGDTQ